VHVAILALLCTVLTQASFAEPASAGGTVITVTSTQDFDGSENRDTCTLTIGSGALTRIAPDGICTLRRAIVQAERLPDSARPINIVFNIATSDPNYDGALGMWEVQIDESDPWAIKSENLKVGGGITIDGNSQPGGRTTGPKIMINNNRDDVGIGGASLIISTPNNVIRNVGFHGGGELQIQAPNNTVEDIWMGLNNAGTGMQTESTSQPDNLAGGGINLSNSNSDDNTIQRNVIIGATSRAISVTSGGSGNLIAYNWIGTNAAGAVDGPLDCVPNTIYFASKWYGGEGIRVTGSNNTISNNLLAGLNTTRATNDTRPIALEIYGTSNLVTNNVVGLDTEQDRVGVCGRGLLIGGSQSTATDNYFLNTKASVTDDIGTLLDSAVLAQSFSGGGQGASDYLEVHSNIVDGGNDNASNYYTYRYGDVSIPEVLRKFNPAKVTAVNGTTVTGTNGDENPQDGIEGFCPGCKIYLYSDDMDDRIEALAILGTAVADSSGNWTATISRPLLAGEGIRTQSQALAPNVIGNHGAKVTTHLSDDLFPLPVAYCNGKVVTINMNLPGVTGVGTTSDDVILGTPGPDVIDAGAGSDTVCGEGGDDIIDGGTGDFRDFLYGGLGNDTMFGGFGIDYMFGEAGQDTLDGEGGSDRLYGGPDNDVIRGDSGADRMYGGPGNDDMFGMGGQDFMWGEGGNDLMQGNFQTDNMWGGSGDDEMFGAGGKDSLYGESGNDTMSGGNNTDYLNGGTGIDVANGGRGRDKPLVAPSVRASNGQFYDGSGCVAETKANCQPN